MQSKSARVFLVVALMALATVTSTHAAQDTVVSNVRPASTGDDIAGIVDATLTTKERAFSFQDALANTWGALAARTLRPSSASATASEADNSSDDSSTSTSTSPSTARPTVKPATTIKADPRAQSADDAVNVALKTQAPSTEPVTLAPPTTFAPPIVITTAPVTTPLPVATPPPTPTATFAPPVDSATPMAPSAAPAVVPSTTPSTPRSTAATASSPHATPADSSSSRTTQPATTSPSTRAPVASKGGNFDSEEFSKSANVRSGLTAGGFDEVIVVIVLGGVGAIAIVVYVMSRKIAKETGDDAAMRETSSFAHL